MKIIEFNFLRLDGLKFEIIDPEYSDVVRAGIRCLAEDEVEVRGMMTNLTSRKEKILSEGKSLIRIRL